MARTDFAAPILRALLTLTLAALLTALPRPAPAADSAGIVLAFAGKAEILRGSERVKVAARTELFNGDTLVTGDGQMQVRFADGTLLTLYRDTRFAVDDYRYGNGKSDKAHFSLIDGLMHTLTGEIAKESYLLKTRLANLGVRGTEYSARLAETLHVSVDQGRVIVANAGGSVLVGAGGSVVVSTQQSMPQPVAGKIELRPHGPAGASPPPAGASPPPAAAPPPPAPPGTQGLSGRPRQTPPGPPGSPAPPGPSGPPGPQSPSSERQGPPPAPPPPPPPN